MGSYCNRWPSLRDRAITLPPLARDRFGSARRGCGHCARALPVLAAADLVSMAGDGRRADSDRAALVDCLQFGQFLYPKPAPRTVTLPLSLAQAGRAHSERA